ncbi:hypothetical protein [Pseudomonas sp. WS 5071]|uniref:hypothetical protein n=1 Tax=Pseudomonas sp. WS 5071 TaxID=2717479 RepID=UPI0014757AC4|nr:hypothetical protein [Pseudomonas sp. WS 5071]NMY76839.1 hypothetical protein [Pseudomonas sp. WS 5071]
MSMDWKQAVSASATTVRINDISDYVRANTEFGSPIDMFYADRNRLLSAISPNYAQLNPTVLPLVLVGLISLTENYFREIFAGIIVQCPKAKEKSASKALNLATAWFGYGELEKGAFENTSFSDAETVKKNIQSLIGLQITDSSQILTPLEEFDKLCELRHAIVHSAGLLAGKNAIKLQLPRSQNSVKVTVGFSELQEAAEICTSLVCAVNLELYIHISKRWLNEWPRTAAYRNEDFNRLFKNVWNLFYSSVDSQNGSISSNLTQIRARNLITRTNAS